MNFKETKFAYHHAPTGKWAFFEIETIQFMPRCVYMHFFDEFSPDCLYAARNIIEEDLLRSTMNGERYAIKHPEEFELLEIEIEYKIKNHAIQ